MFFRFGSALALVVLISLAGVGLEKRNLELRRAISHQHFQTDVLLEEHARLRLRTQQLGAPERVLEQLPATQLEVQHPADSARQSRSPRRLLNWQRPLSVPGDRQPIDPPSPGGIRH